jgi:uncharacterized protein (UPF0548 family)
LFTLRSPSESQIRPILDRNCRTAFSYREVGASQREILPSGYNLDRNEIVLGSGQTTYESAKRALRAWKMFDIDWLRVFPESGEIEKDTLVAVVPSHFGFSSINLCRIIYVFESPTAYGFAYGTLTEHAEKGEERFTVSWNPPDDSVRYEIVAFSKPRALLARLGYPLSRAMQKKFAQASLAAMARAVAADQT